MLLNAMVHLLGGGVYLMNWLYLVCIMSVALMALYVKWSDIEDNSCVVYYEAWIACLIQIMPKWSIWLCEAYKMCDLMNEGLKHV